MSITQTSYLLDRQNHLQWGSCRQGGLSHPHNTRQTPSQQHGSCSCIAALFCRHFKAEVLLYCDLLKSLRVFNPLLNSQEFCPVLFLLSEGKSKLTLICWNGAILLSFPDMALSLRHHVPQLLIFYLANGCKLCDTTLLPGNWSFWVF